MISELSLSSSDHVLIIDLEKVKLEDIVEKKMRYFLDQKKNLFEKNLFEKFYSPIEYAFCKFALQLHGGSQIRSALFLGLNRNTLKKKIHFYKINIKKLILNKKERPYPISRIFLSSLSALDLVSVSRDKLAWDYFHNQMPKENVLKQMHPIITKKIIEQVLLKCGGKQVRASELLGWNRNTVKKKMNAYFKQIKVCL